MAVANPPSDTAAPVEMYGAAFAAARADLPGSERIQALRQSAIDRFTETGFPSRRDENWRNTNLAPIAQSVKSVSATPAQVTAADLDRYSYENFTQLVVVNGRLAPELSRLDNLPEGVIVGSLASAIEEHPELVDEHLGRYADIESHPFVALNTALFRDGAFLYVPPKVVLEQPINLIVASTPEAEPAAMFPRLLMVAGESAQMTVFEQHVTVGPNEDSTGGNYFTCPLLEAVTGDNATIDHYKLQRESKDAFHLSTLQVTVGRDASFSSHCLSWGGAIVRNDVNATLDGEGCEAHLNGLYMVEGLQYVNNHMRVEHNAPHCFSHNLYKGVLEGKARTSFTGRIYVKEGAQKTDAIQTNRNLLLSDDALAHSQPQLEIFADDVKCTHGSTTGQLDDIAVFYLRSRGIGEEAARSLLTYAFAADIVTRVKVPQLRQDLEEFLFRRLPKGEVVRQAV